MNEKRAFGFHTTALAAIFVLGNAVTILPDSNADEFTFLAFIIAAVLAVLIYISSEFLLKLNIKAFKILLYSLSAIFSLFLGAFSFKDTVNFVSAVILPQTAKPLISLVFFSVLLYFFFKAQENILKFALISFVLIGAIIVFFFLAAADKYDFQNIVILRLPKFSGFLGQIRPYIKDIVLPIPILAVYFKLQSEGEKRNHIIFGIFIGIIFAGLCILMALLTFGPSLAGRLDFPFSSAVSTVTVGRLFTRLDGFSYFVFFVSSLLKITVCGKVGFESLKRINCKLKGTE